MKCSMHSSRWPGSPCLAVLFLCLSPSAWSATPVDYLSPLEQEVVKELNFARTQPQAYAEIVAELLPYHRGYRSERPGRVTLRTQDGRTAIEEAVRFLRKATPLEPLKPSPGMSLAALGHAQDLKHTGNIGHGGSDGSQPWDRLNRYGEWQIMAGENVALGSETARDVVISLLVNDRVQTRRHPKNMFQPDFRLVGVACGEHGQYGTVCVMDLAAGFVEGRDDFRLRRDDGRARLALNRRHLPKSMSGPSRKPLSLD